MRYEEFMGRVEDRLQSPRPGEAEQAIVATFDTLGERISGGEASDIAELLPEELAEPLRRAGGDAERFGLEAFFRRVAEKENTDVSKATEHASVVMAVLGQAITEGECKTCVPSCLRSFIPSSKDRRLEHV